MKINLNSMKEILDKLQAPDFEFLVKILGSKVNYFVDFKSLEAALKEYEKSNSQSSKSKLIVLLEKEIRYYGSSDFAYIFRKAVKKEPGARFRKIIINVAKSLKINIKHLNTEEGILEEIVIKYSSKKFAKLSLKDKQNILVDLGVEKEEAKNFALNSIKKFSLPALISILGAKGFEKFIINIAIAAISKYIGKEAARKIITELAKKFPWWAEWAGPVLWAITGAWTLIDIQGPAKRKTVPIVLYLGICMIRDGLEDSDILLD